MSSSYPADDGDGDQNFSQSGSDVDNEHQSEGTHADLDQNYLRKMSRSEPNINREANSGQSEHGASLGHAHSMASVQSPAKSPKGDHEFTVFHGVTYLGECLLLLYVFF